MSIISEFKKTIKELTKRNKKMEISLVRLRAARFEMSEMLKGVTEIKTRKSIQYWVEHLSQEEHTDFMVVAYILISQEITRQENERKGCFLK